MKIIIMQGHQTGNMTTHTPNIMDAISTLTEAAQIIVNRDKTITSMLLTLPEHQVIIDENKKLRAELESLKHSKEDGDSVKITIHEKNSATVPTLSAKDIRDQYGVEAQNILKDVKTVTAQLGSIALDNVDSNSSDGSIKKHINDFSQKLYELVDSVDTSNDIYSDIHAIADDFESTFKPWLVSAIPKQSLINLLPVPRTTDYKKIDLNVNDMIYANINDDEEISDDDDVSGEDDDDEEEEEEEEEEDDDDVSQEEDDDEEEEEDDVSQEEDDDEEEEEEEEEETSLDNVDTVANKWDKKEHDRVIQGNKEEEDLSEEEEDDGTTNTSEDEENLSEEEEEEDEEEVETSSEELVVCEMEDEDGHALEYLTNDPAEMNGDIFELLDGDEVGKKIGRFVDGEPEFFD